MFNSILDNQYPDSVFNVVHSRYLSLPNKPIDVVEVLYNYGSQDQNNILPLIKGEIVYVLDKSSSGWWDGVVFKESSDPLEITPVRGWFPQSFTKSTQLMTMILQRQSAKSHDSLSSSMSETRKNQNSSHDSVSESPNNLEIIPTSSSSANSKILNLKEAEKLAVSKMGSDPGYWLPQLGPEGKTLYYNADLDVYCNELPFSSSNSTKSLELSLPSSPTIATSGEAEALIRTDSSGQQNKRGQKLVNFFKSSLPKTKAANQDDQLRRQNRRNTAGLSVSSSNVNSNAPLRHGHSASNSIGYHHSNSSLIQMRSEAESGSAHNAHAATSDSTSATGTSLGIATAAAMPAVSNTKKLSRNIFEMSEYFVKHPTDLTSWDTFKNIIFLLLDKCGKCLVEDDSQGFTSLFGLSARLLLLIRLCAKLHHDSLIKHGFEMSLQKRLTKISKSVASASASASLYFNIKTFEDPNTTGFGADMQSLDFENYEYEDDEFLKLTSQTTNTHHSDSNSSTQQSKDVTETITNKVLAAQLEQGHEFDLKKEHDSSSSTSYLEIIKVEMKLLKRHVLGCYNVFKKLGDQSENALKIPQVYPRFLTGFFSGGSWQNPFFDDMESKATSESDDKRKELLIKDFQQRCRKVVALSHENLVGLSAKSTSFFENLDEIIAHLNTDIGSGNNNKLVEKKNFNIISAVYKALTLSTQILEVIECFDMSLFNSSLSENDDQKSSTSNQIGNYTLLFGGNMNSGVVSIAHPILTEYYESKQDLQNGLSELIMESQYLTAKDPSVFKVIQKSAQNPRPVGRTGPFTLEELSSDLRKLMITEEGIGVIDNTLLMDFDKSISETVDRIRNSLTILLITVSQLVDEKESLINYSERMMQNSNLEDYEPERKIDLSDTGYRLKDPNLVKPRSGSDVKDKSEDAPWYLDSDEEYDLCYDSNYKIKGGTKEALVTHLTNHQHFDPNFNKVFLCTFCSMMTPAELIELLIARYDIKPPEELSYEEYRVWVEKKAYPIRLRCVNVMKMLLQKFWIDSYSQDRKMLENWYRFTQKLKDNNFPLHEVLANEIREKLGEKNVVRRGAGGLGTNISQSIIPPSMEPAPKVILPEVSKHHRKLRLFDINPLEFARQLTLRDFHLYSQITVLQCLERLWKDKYGLYGSSKHITEFISNSNKLTGYVSFIVLRRHDVHKRAKTIDYFIKVAEYCRQINNFSSMTAIISSLSASPVHRLRRTWALVNKESQDILESMNRLMNRKKNFSSYREMLKHVSGVSCVPFVGVYLSDLTFISNGTPDYLNGDPKVINFYKRSKIADTIQNIIAFQTISYPFKRIDSIQKFIKKGIEECPSEDSQYQISLILEPRESVGSQFNAKLMGAPLQSPKILDHNNSNVATKKNSMSSSTASEDSTQDNISETTSATVISANTSSMLPTLQELKNMKITDEDMKKYFDYFEEDLEDISNDEEEGSSSSSDTDDDKDLTMKQNYDEPYDEENEDEDVNKLRNLTME